MLSPRLFAPCLFALALLAFGALPAAAADYEVSGTLSQDPSEFNLGLDGDSFEMQWSSGGLITSNTTSSQAEATYDANGMQFSIGGGAPASCSGSPTMTLKDRVSGSDRVEVDNCEGEFEGFSVSVDGNFSIANGNMATSAPADISSTSMTGSLTIRVSGENESTSFHFDLNNGTLSADGAEPPSVSITPSSVSLMADYGTTTAVEQVVSFSASQAVSYSISTSGGSWLDVNPTAGNTSSTITVSADPTGLTPGTYNGTVTLDYGSQASDSIPVTFEITGMLPTLSLAPSSLTFDYQQGDSAPASQQLDVTSSAPVDVDSVSVSTSSGGSWLSANPTSGSTPLGVSVSVNPSGLSPGTYNGTVTVAAALASNSPRTASVTLNVTAAPTLSLSPSSLTFNHQQGDSAPASQNIDVSATNGPASFSASASTTSGGNWLSVAPSGGNTPQTLSVSVDPSGLGPGSYSGSVTVTSAEASNSPQTVTVTLNVSDAPVLNLNPSQLTFNYQLGGSTPGGQPVNVTGSTALSYNVSTSGGSWLAVSSTSGNTPGSFVVTVNPSGLSAGTYNAVVTVTSGGAGNSPQTVPVTLNVTESQPTLSASPTQLNFSAQAGGAAPASQNVSLSSSAPTGFTAEATLGAFLSVSPTSGTTPGSISVSVDAEGLAPGTYNGVVTVTPDGGSPVSVNVILQVSLEATLTAAPESLSFTYFVNGEVPAPATVGLAATEEMTFMAAASGGDWLAVTPAEGSTPADLMVAVAPEGLEPGEYLGEISVTAGAASNSPVLIPVSLTVILGPVFSSDNLLNAASFELGQPPASGGLASVFGSFPGATPGAASAIPLPTDIEDLTVRIRPLAAALTEEGKAGQVDYTPAPLLFVSGEQINFQAPWEVPPGPAEMIVSADGVDSEAVEIVLAEVHPGVFTFDFGPGRAVAFLPSGVVAQPEGSIEGVATRPVQIGEPLIILATGLGPLTGPPLASGDNSLDESGAFIRRDTAFPTRVLIGGQEAEVFFSGASPQFVGVNQVNVAVPEGVEPGAEVPLILEVNGVQSRADVTIAVDPAP